MLPVFYSSKFHNGPKSLLVKRPEGGGGRWTSFLPASPHIVPPALTCSCVTHIVNGLVMGLQRLLMKRRFCLHTRATRHYPDNSDWGSPLGQTCPTQHLLPDSLLRPYKSLRKGGGGASFWQDVMSPLRIGRAHTPPRYYSTGRSRRAACFCLNVRPAVNGRCGFFIDGANLFCILVRHMFVPPVSRT